SQNLAFLAKFAGRIASSPDSLLASIMRAKYHKNVSFWDASKPNRASWSWRSLLKGKEIIKSSMKWAIGNGEHV
ncbi:hypothetical protein MKW92_028326, partial [Papaver armeniacum]